MSQTQEEIEVIQLQNNFYDSKYACSCSAAVNQFESALVHLMQSAEQLRSERQRLEKDNIALIAKTGGAMDPDCIRQDRKFSSIFNKINELYNLTK